jgi:hypothetical protein
MDKLHYFVGKGEWQNMIQDRAKLIGYLGVNFL